MPEFGGWMVEAVPKEPYNTIENAADLLSVEESLKERRAVLDKFFKEKDVQIVSMTNVPGFGTQDFIELTQEQTELYHKLE